MSGQLGFLLLGQFPFWRKKDPSPSPSYRGVLRRGHADFEVEQVETGKRQVEGGLIVWRLISNQVGSSVLLNPVLHRFTGYCSA
ncbi:unnamed protein product [Callosobruchus maculatus]|uniref:Uncharacterized protein n=1 Tax=Callosobruchus maculatus TaxID=64391 RepID=A0A653BTZ6_CALMS|nr:unnamed protein product [Callosobruchus maculatus]VEN38971.1 unnamed protein product [Callosobruchus maculatus]